MTLALTTSAMLATEYSDGRTDSLGVPGRASAPATAIHVHHRQSIPTGGAALDLGSISSLGALMVVNTDPTNYVNLYSASGEKLVAILRPDTDQDGNGGSFKVDETGADMQAPYATANVAACVIEIFAVST